MLKNLTRRHLIEYWFAMVSLAAALSIVEGATPSLVTATLLLALSLVPAAIVMKLWPAAPPPTPAGLRSVQAAASDFSVLNSDQF